MRGFAIAFGLACTAGFATPAFAQQLSYEPLYSIGEVKDADEDRTAEYEAAQSLIERWGLSGVTYSDNTMKPDMAITRGEAIVLLASAFDQGASLAQAQIDNAEGELDPAAYDRMQILLSLMASQSTCLASGDTRPKGMAPDPRMEEAAFRLVDAYGTGGPILSEDYSDPLDWGTALRCAPMAGPSPELVDSQGEPVEADQPIARGDFFVLLDNGMNLYAERLGSSD